MPRVVRAAAAMRPALRLTLLQVSNEVAVGDSGATTPVSSVLSLPPQAVNVIAARKGIMILRIMFLRYKSVSEMRRYSAVAKKSLDHERKFEAFSKERQVGALRV